MQFNKSDMIFVFSILNSKLALQALVMIWDDCFLLQTFLLLLFQDFTIDFNVSQMYNVLCIVKNTCKKYMYMPIFAVYSSMKTNIYLF